MCGGTSKGLTFPYTTIFNKEKFNSLKCSICDSVFIDPVPDEQTFSLIYAKSDYHDQFYSHINDSQYTESVQLLCKYIKSSASILDFGCGTGYFLKECKSHGLLPFGVEFDKETVQFAANISNCSVISLEDFHRLKVLAKFDAIHLGDVLEHLPNPTSTLVTLLCFLKPGGVLFVEGPLEENPSFVLWTARVFGGLKRLIKPNFISSTPPTHLVRTDAEAQKRFFSIADPSLKMIHWQIYETGWPYAQGGLIKRTIAFFAKMIGGKRVASITFGNRFKTVLLKNDP